MKKEQKVFCRGCANLLLIEGQPPQCVATAEFIEGPLRERIDVSGRVAAEKRNRHNDCTYREVVSLRAYQLKRWILWRMNDEGRSDKYRPGRLGDYSVGLERKKYKEYEAIEKIDEQSDDTGESDETESILQKLAEEENILPDGGDGSDDSGTADDKG
jgi:hypothetical protein